MLDDAVFFITTGHMVERSRLWLSPFLAFFVPAAFALFVSSSYFNFVRTQFRLCVLGLPDVL